MGRREWTWWDRGGGGAATPPTVSIETLRLLVLQKVWLRLAARIHTLRGGEEGSGDDEEEVENDEER